jgi:ribonuclease P protein component
MRLPASRRLRRHGEFARVRERGAGHKGRFIVLSVLQLGDGSPWRCGFITSRKTGGAVQRNRIRRRLREIVRAHGARLSPGAWIVTIARPNAADASMQELEQDWTRTAIRAGVLGKTTDAA